KFKKEIIQETQRSDSDYWLNQILKHFVFDEVLPANKNGLLYDWLSQLSLETFNTFCSTYIQDKPDDMGIISPTYRLYSEDTVRKWIENSLVKKITPYTQSEIPKQLMSDSKLATLKVDEYVYHRTAISGAQEFKLKNGLKLVLDTTNSSTNRIYIHGFRPKGAASYSKEKYFSA